MCNKPRHVVQLEIEYLNALGKPIVHATPIHSLPRDYVTINDVTEAIRELATTTLKAFEEVDVSTYIISVKVFCTSCKGRLIDDAHYSWKNEYLESIPFFNNVNFTVIALLVAAASTDAYNKVTDKTCGILLKPEEHDFDAIILGPSGISIFGRN